MIYIVGDYYHVLDHEIAGQYGLDWLFERFFRISEARYNAQVSAITETELGVLRALTVSFGDKKRGQQLPALPTYEQVRQERTEKQRVEASSNDWMQQYAKANAKRFKHLKQYIPPGEEEDPND